MAANGIEPAKVIEFSSAVHVAAQQMKSRMRGRTQVKYGKAEDMAYDGIGSVEAVEITSRLQRTQAQSIDNSRRKIHMREFRCTLLLDRKDQLEVIFDPQNQYAMAVSKALYRKYDRVALSAAFADVATGKNFQTNITYLNDGVTQVDATGGFTYEKLQEVEGNFEGNEVGTEEEMPMYLACSEQEKTDLMGENEIISNQVVTTGVTSKNGSRLIQAGPFDLIVFGSRQPVPMITTTNGGTVRRCVAAANDGICVGITNDIDVEVNTRPDMNNAWQIQASMFMGSVRTEGKEIQEVLTTVKY